MDDLNHVSSVTPKEVVHKFRLQLEVVMEQMQWWTYLEIQYPVEIKYDELISIEQFSAWQNCLLRADLPNFKIFDECDFGKDLIHSLVQYPTKKLQAIWLELPIEARLLFGKKLEIFRDLVPNGDPLLEKLGSSLLGLINWCGVKLNVAPLNKPNNPFRLNAVSILSDLAANKSVLMFVPGGNLLQALCKQFSILENVEDALRFAFQVQGPMRDWVARNLNRTISFLSMLRRQKRPVIYCVSLPFRDIISVCDSMYHLDFVAFMGSAPSLQAKESFSFHVDYAVEHNMRMMTFDVLKALCVVAEAK
jgi:hypothetical protein